MTAILKPDNGRLVIVRSPEGATPAVLKIPGLNDGTTSAGVIITSFTLSASVAHQITPTVGGPEYVYVFGDSLGQATIGLVTYPNTCDDEDNSGSFAKAWQYYMSNRMTPRQVKTLSLSFCGITIKGLLISFVNELNNQNGFAVIRGTMTLRAWVDPTTISGGTQ
jgi:hypothetical protein